MTLTPIESWIRPQDETFTLVAGQTRALNVSDMLGDDLGLNGSILRIKSVEQPDHGSLTLQADGNYLYTPEAGYLGAVKFNYTVTDQFGNVCTEHITGTITAAPPNLAPTVVNEFVDVKAGVAVSAPESLLIANDSDADGGKLSVGNYGKPSHGTLSRAADGTLTYIADANYSGADSFTYEVSDGQGGVTIGKVNLNVLSAENQAPVAQGEFASVRGGTSVSAPESLLLANDVDPEGGALTVKSLGQPANGTLVRAADGTLTYTPKAGFVGTDSFSYVVADAQGKESTASVTLTVTAPVVKPVFSGIDDNSGDKQGQVGSGGGTDDRTPTFKGIGEPGALVELYDGQTKIGETHAGADGAWQITPANPLSSGAHSLAVRTTAPDGATADSAPFQVTIGADAPGLTLLTDANGDGNISQAELEAAGGLDVKVTLGSDAKAGDHLLLVDQDGHRIDRVLTAADIAAKSLTLDNAFAAPANGQAVAVSATLQDAAGNVSLSSSVNAAVAVAPGGHADSATVQAFGAPVATILAMDLNMVHGVLSAPLATGMKVVLHNGNFPYPPDVVATISSDGLHWTAVPDNPDPRQTGTWVYTPQVQLTVDGTSTVISEGQTMPGAPSGRTSESREPLVFETQAQLDAALATGAQTNLGNAPVLRLAGDGMRLDLTQHDSTPGSLHDLNNIHHYDLVAGAGRNSLVLSINDVLTQGVLDGYLRDGIVRVTVDGDANDTLSLKHLLNNGGDAGNWQANGTFTANNIVYNVYSHSTLPGEVRVQQGVKVDLPADPGVAPEAAAYAQVTGNVLSNDVNPNGLPSELRVAAVGTTGALKVGEGMGTVIEGEYGHLTLRADGSYVYVADKSAGLSSSQVDSFSYLFQDAQGRLADSTATTLNIQVVVPSSNAQALSLTADNSEISTDPAAPNLAVWADDAVLPEAESVQILPASFGAEHSFEAAMAVSLARPEALGITLPNADSAPALLAADLLPTDLPLDAVLPAAQAEALALPVEVALPTPMVDTNTELLSLQWHTGLHRELMTETAML